MFPTFNHVIDYGIESWLVLMLCMHDAYVLSVKSPFLSPHGSLTPNVAYNILALPSSGGSDQYAHRTSSSAVAQRP